MPSADAALRSLAVALLIACSAHAAEPQYGKVETFEPGKKYTCLPTADKKGWDCREATSKDASAAAQSNRPTAPAVAASAAAAQAPSAPAASAAAPQASVESQPSQPRADAPVSTTTAPPTTARNSGLPLYLRAPGASTPPAAQLKPQKQAPAPAESPAAKAAPEPVTTPPPPSSPTVATQASASPPHTEPERTNAATKTPVAAPAIEAPPEEAATHEPAKVEKNSAPSPSPSPPAHDSDAPVPATAEARPAPTPSAASAEPAAAAPEPAPAAPKPAMSAANAAGSGGIADFLALPGSAYIVELAHAANKSELDTLRTSLHPARGQLYELHLLRDGADWWLLVWGTFDSIDAARAARSELPSDAPLNAGWPRLVAPLQKEARHAAE